MYSIWSRLNDVFFFNVSVAIGFGLLSALTVLNHNPEILGGVTDHDITDFGIYRYRRIMNPVTRTTCILDFDIDLRPQWNWNTRQMFLWVQADYETPGRSHSVSLWDKIITDVEDTHIVEYSTRPEYDFMFLESQMPGTKIQMTLHWEIFPTIGWVKHRASKTIYNFTLPDDYFYD